MKGGSHGKIVGGSLSSALSGNEATPCFMTLMDDLCRVFLILGFTRERESVFGLSIRDLVDPERSVSSHNEKSDVEL